MDAQPSIWSGFAASMLPLVVTVATALIGVATTVVTVRLNSWFGITNDTAQRANEQLVRNVLHDAVWSAVKYAAMKTGLTLDQLSAISAGGSASSLTSKEFIDVALAYVRSKNPDTAAAAGLAPGASGDAGLTEIIISKVPDLIKMLVEAAVPGGPVVGAIVGAAMDAATKSLSPNKSGPAVLPSSPRRGG
jgi:hypothetical protein